MKEKRKFLFLQRRTDKVPRRLDPTAWVGYMSNLLCKLRFDSAVPVPAPAIMPGFRKKASAQEHEKDPTQLLFDTTAQW